MAPLGPSVLCWVGAVLGFVLVAKVASVLERRTLTMSVKVQLRFWCAVDVL